MKPTTREEAGGREELAGEELEEARGGGIIYVPVGGRIRPSDPAQQAELDAEGAIGPSDFFATVPPAP